MRFEVTRHLDNRRFIEAEADWRGTMLWLRARLCEDSIVIEAHRRDFCLDDCTIAGAVETFSTEFAAIAGLFVGALLPADMFAPRCPAAPQHWPDALAWGICAGTVEQPHVVPIPPEPVTPELLAQAAPATPREVYRMAAVCIKGGCPHWRDGTTGAGDGNCSLVERVIAAYPTAIEDKLQPCGIRSVCRWFAQEGAAACRACPGVVTDLGELPQSRDAEADVPFF